MNNKKTIGSIAVILVILFVPFSSFASEVLWLTESYRSYAYADLWDSSGIFFSKTIEDSQEFLSPPSSLPLASSAYVAFDDGDGVYAFGDADSGVTSSNFNVYASAKDWCCIYGFANAISSFTGTFTASQPTFEFSYGLTSSGGSYTSYTGWLTLNDLTDSTTLTNLSLTEGSDTVSVALPDMHDIEVKFGINASSGPPITYHSAATRQATLTFNTAVAPEPISTVLFVTGGTVLAGRRFLRRKT